jgi:meso-butanediol dehydrogenase/(S,S)-butanediol dehydrogenase/diacetyl reductase
MQPSPLLAGKRAVVTGGASGIGKAIATALSAAGARVAVTDMNGAAATNLAKEIGASAIADSLDVTDAVATARLFGRLQSRP